VRLAACGLAALLVFALSHESPARTDSSWTKISAGGKTRCVRGGPYAFWLRRGDPKKLLLFFQGGGGCLARAYPEVTFARFNHAIDDVQERFYAALGADPAGFEPRLRAAEGTLKQLPNYRSYVACGSNHCALQTLEFDSLRVDGVRLRDWVADLARGRDVRCPTCG